jgi:hypothetical protein
VPAKKTPVTKTPATPSSPAPARPRARKSASPAVPPVAATPRAPRIVKATIAPAVEPKTINAAPTTPEVRKTVRPEDIQVRAYFLALENGGKGGSLDFWLRAERELLQGAPSGD